MGQAEQDPDLPPLASNILAKVQFHLYLTVAGQVEVLAGEVNFRGSLPRSENNVFSTYVAPCRSKPIDVFLLNEICRKN